MVRRRSCALLILATITFPTSSSQFNIHNDKVGELPLYPLTNNDDTKISKRCTQAAAKTSSTTTTTITSRKRRRRRATEGATLHPEEEDNLAFFDQLYNSVASTLHPPLSNRTIVQYNTSDDGGGGVLSINYTLCHLSAFLNLVNAPPDSTTNTNVPSINGIRSAASALMAIIDFNTGNNSIIPQIKQCNNHNDKLFHLRFTMELIDTQREPLLASTKLVHILDRKKHPIPPPPPLEDDKRRNLVQAYPTGIIGAIKSAVTSPLSTLGGVNDLVTISHGSSSDELSHEREYPLFGRTIPSTYADAQALISFFENVLNATHLGVLYVNDVFGASYARSIGNFASRKHDDDDNDNDDDDDDSSSKMVVKSIALPVNASQEEAAKSLQMLNETGYRYFVGILFADEFQTVMPMAYDLGLAGEEYFWMFTEVQLQLMNGSPLSSTSLLKRFSTDVLRAVNGSAILATASGKGLLGRSHFYNAYVARFEELWGSEEGWSYLQSKLPGMDLTRDLIQDAKEPSVKELFLYEAVIALCLASCDAAANTTTSASDFYTANELYQSFTRTTFDGLYGPASFDHKTGDRDTDTVSYAVYNILTTKEDNNKKNNNNTFTVDAKYQQILRNGTAFWILLHNEEFVFANGKTVPPDNLPPLEENMNWVPKEIAALCITLGVIIMVLSIACTGWTFLRRKTKVVCASQPFFLYLLCAGTFIMGFSHIPLGLTAIGSYDKGMAAMWWLWLSDIGFLLSFSALFSKTMRIHKIMATGRKHKRIVVRPVDVMKPFFILLALILISLITLSAMAPLEYVREPNDTSVDQFGRINESYGTFQYQTNHQVVGVILNGLSLLINTVAICLSGYYAYQARSISTEYNESAYIAIILVALLQICLFVALTGFLIIGDPTKNLLVATTATSCASFSMMIPMFVPKVLALREERKEELEKEKRKEERLERLRRFDALKKEQDDDAAIISTGSKTPDTDEVDNFVDDDETVDEKYGIKIIAFSKTEVYKKLDMKLSKKVKENKKLKGHIDSLKGPLKEEAA